jgi:hypothetical protein
MSQPLTTAARRAGPPTPGPCHACGLSLFECWRFRDDDQFCSLCGADILELQVREQAPDPNDRRLWIYQRRDSPPRLTLTWRRQAAGGNSRLTLKPVLDYRRCRARFRHANLGDLVFDLRGAALESDGEHDLTVALVPNGWRLEDVTLPDSGLEGEVRFAWGARDEPRKALLLPRLANRITCRCADPTNRPVDGALQVYQRGKSVPLAMELRSEVAAYLREVSGGGTDIVVKSDGLPCLLRPGKPYRFTLQMDTSRWSPRQKVGFALTLHLHTLTPIRLEGGVALVEGEDLSFGQSDVWEGDVPLGRVCYPSFLLTASEATAAPGITLAGKQILYEGGADGWLRVLSPDTWPCAVPPRGGGDPVALRMEVDTTGLDRRRFDGSLQQASVELRDTRHRPWTCRVRLTLRRPERLRQFLAIDWGTTNSCASYRGSDRDPPLAVRFESDQQSPEQYPSDIYFKDVSDPENPVFFVGFQARQFAEGHPECCLRSLKRKFQFQDEVFVMDEHRRPHRYKIADLITLVLLRLVALAEETLGREVTRLGLTFPTKWLPRVRRRLKTITEEVGRRMQAQRTGEQVLVLPPEIDEANAVALQVLTAPREAPLPPSFHLVAYDFGGGTVDTALLHVEFAPASRKLATRYLGIGGRSDFGGDDVTRAVLLLLHQRLPRALRGRTLALDAERAQMVRLLDIPLIRDGTPPSADTDEDTYRKGRKNWDVFWKAAEGIKIALCSPQVPVAAVPVDDGPRLAAETPPEGPVTLPADPYAHLVGQRIEQYYTDITCRVIDPGGSEQMVALDALLRYLPGEELDQFRKDMNFTLEEVYQVEIPPGDGSQGGQPFRISQRVDDTIRELRWQCNEQQVEPYLIVLAGGGCGLPLVSALFNKYFGKQAGHADPLLEYNPAFSKQRVAHGMAGYLFLRQFARLDDLAHSVKVLHHALGLMQLEWENGLKPRFRTIAPVGAAVNAPGVWHRFSFDLLDGDQRLPLFLQDWRDGPQPFGYIDFTETTAALPEDPTWEAGPLPAATSYEGQLRLRGAECLEACVTVEGRTYGPFPIVATVSDPEAALQG